MSSSATLPSDAPWHVQFPAPRSSPPRLAASEVAELVRTKNVGTDYVVVDVRRTDFENVCVRGAINVPAQSFYTTLPGLLPVLARTPKVIFYCNSSNGRGPRCAGWYQDALDTASQTQSQAFILEGGIKAWAEKFGDDPELVTKV